MRLTELVELESIHTADHKPADEPASLYSSGDRCRVTSPGVDDAFDALSADAGGGRR
jgi:hypothetical protein